MASEFLEQLPGCVRSREPRKRRRLQPTLIEPFLEYCRLQLADDPLL
ncbi:Uncharacterised protein [Amycolatopsis camponoti]|uniref:Uncharacterized protein n=1 Tax=Amycolatopsis camponoti TaxID=2606593 RepID=A0A6I8M205_9PSEU|nr:hypothetical protein [Amycolatopsis camponoti]VVJ21626.1 Uncharacterised protein [Amycolatopsis camponoti]